MHINVGAGENTLILNIVYKIYDDVQKTYVICVKGDELSAMFDLDEM